MISILLKKQIQKQQEELEIFRYPRVLNLEYSQIDMRTMVPAIKLEIFKAISRTPRAKFTKRYPCGTLGIAQS